MSSCPHISLTQVALHMPHHQTITDLIFVTVDQFAFSRVLYKMKACSMSSFLSGLIILRFIHVVASINYSFL